MRSIQEYVDLAYDKWREDGPVTGISLSECVAVIVDQAFFNDEIMFSNLDLLKKRVSQEITKKSTKNYLTS
jgi:hypothetical protein